MYVPFLCWVKAVAFGVWGPFRENVKKIRQHADYWSNFLKEVRCFGPLGKRSQFSESWSLITKVKPCGSGEFHLGKPEKLGDFSGQGIFYRWKSQRRLDNFEKLQVKKAVKREI